MSCEFLVHLTRNREQELTEAQIEKFKKLAALGSVLRSYPMYGFLPRDYCHNDKLIRECRKLDENSLNLLITRFMAHQSSSGRLCNTQQEIDETLRKLSLEPMSAYILLYDWFDNWVDLGIHEEKEIIMKNAIDLIYTLNGLTAKILRRRKQ